MDRMNLVIEKLCKESFNLLQTLNFFSSENKMAEKNLPISYFKGFEFNGWNEIQFEVAWMSVTDKMELPKNK